MRISMLLLSLSAKTGRIRPHYTRVVASESIVDSRFFPSRVRSKRSPKIRYSTSS
jgi:hypothetical protein